jgi:hypothetical protein
MVVVHEGATNLCDIQLRCSEATSGTMSVASQEGIRAVPPGVDRNQRLNAFFPLVRSQSGLNQVFVVQVPSGLGDGANDNDPRHDGTGDDDKRDEKPPAKPDRPDDKPPDGRPIRPPDGRPAR